jgi:PAS domain S-box-containing protein
MLRKLLKDPKFLINVFETMREGLVIIDLNGEVVYFNRAAEVITGFCREEVIGKSCTMLDNETCTIVTDPKKEKRCGLFEKGAIFNKKCRITCKDKRHVYLLKNAVILKDDNGEPVAGIESITDITSLYMKELELEELKKGLRDEYWFMGLLGKSPLMQRLYDQIRNAAMSEAPVLIYGESGTGKNLIANAIHKLSRRKDGPFTHVNCASFNDSLLESELFGHKRGSFTGAVSDRIGRFEAANRGTIFLDEIGDMPQLMQAKLLRVLEEKVMERVGDNKAIHVDIRLISATNKDLDELVSTNKFREDLLYRINSILVRTPSLRERVEDIPVLASHYMQKISSTNNKDVKRISPSAMEMMGNYSWPGNVRQLINALEHSVITCKGDTIEVTDLPEYVFYNKRINRNENHINREKIHSALALYKGNRTLAAKHLGISRVTLWKKLKEFSLDQI